MNNTKTAERIFDVLNATFLVLLSLAAIYPLYHVVMASFSNGNDLATYTGFLFLPMNPTVEGYQAIAQNGGILTGYLNTIFIVVVGVAINVLLTAMTAYALSRNDVMHRRPIILFIIFTMYFGGGLIPFFLTVKGLGLNNNLFALILPGAISVFNFLILRTSFESVPPSLEESAKMDGANDFTILFRIFLPLMAPFIAVIALYYGVAHWNAWFNALLFIQDRELYPLQLILREILLISQSNNSAAGDVITSDNSYETIKYALIVVGTLPILMVYPFLQKYFVKGAMIGAVKG